MTHTPEPSNPRHCPHSMVTDLCGLCIRDRQIKTLEQQNAALSEQVAGLVGAVDIWQENPTTGNGFALIDAAAIAKAGSHE